MEVPEEWTSSAATNKVCQLKRALYGLKQAPRAWYSNIDVYLQQKQLE